MRGPSHLNYQSTGSATGVSGHLHNQSFHGGNTSQHTATFQGVRDTNNTQNSNPTANGGGAGGFFDLNNLAYNVANEYLRPNNNGGLNLPGGIGGTFDQQHSSGAPLVQNNFYRPSSINANEYANRQQQPQIR